MSNEQHVQMYNSQTVSKQQKHVNFRRGEAIGKKEDRQVVVVNVLKSHNMWTAQTCGNQTCRRAIQELTASHVFSREHWNETEKTQRLLIT